ncbi:hypothetical protein MTO96_041172, partial [Rhipicephalus appendiculatus]
MRNQLATQFPPSTSGGHTGKGGVPALQRAPGDSDGSTSATGKETENQPASKVGDLKSSNEPPTERSGVYTPTNVAAASKRPPPPDQQRRDSSDSAWRRGTPCKDGT